MTGGGGTVALQAPSASIESFVATPFEQALRVSTVDKHASFFDLGGDSALSVTLIVKVRATVTDQVSLR